ncbi:MAG: RNA pseudouridine synthase [Bdellovibrionaceae bacterium]|nr:RNA pseudouridine synthase [Pseudobdellovibrionaceae bacterium]
MKPIVSHPDFEAWNKPNTMSTHNEEPSLQAEIQKIRPGPVNFLNRLDAVTSGIVVTVRDPAKMKEYQDLWQQASTRKIYIGLHRRPNGFEMKPQVWDLPLTDKTEGRKNPQGLSKDRVPSRTLFTPLLETRYFVLSAMVLESGRQHQIRKHAALARCEIVGDFRYGDSKYLGSLNSYVPDLRLGLHAGVLQWSPGEIRAEIPEFFEKHMPGARAAFEAFLSLDP